MKIVITISLLLNFWWASKEYIHSYYINNYCEKQGLVFRGVGWEVRSIFNIAFLEIPYNHKFQCEKPNNG